MEKFYHYTTIETLALILKTKKLRFTRLDLVDDLDETRNVKNKLASQFLISCWTLDKCENIPLWNMYSGKKGVRISTSIIPIKTTKIYSKDGSNNFFESPLVNNFLIHEESNSKYFYYPPSNEFSFYDVEYESTEEVVRRKENCSTDYEINTQDLAALKTDYWSFQKEKRLIVYLDPIMSDVTSVESYFIEKQSVEAPFTHYDLDLRDDFLKDIEITLSPYCDDYEFVIVEALLKEYTKGGILLLSELKNRVRN